MQTSSSTVLPNDAHLPKQSNVHIHLLTSCSGVLATDTS
uniref:Uncharacterized protein n=1 Tax=Rhizophora mucronata TaxID=61149 RepID=A0A2P2J2C5_RHIMU